LTKLAVIAWLAAVWSPFAWTQIKPIQDAATIGLAIGAVAPDFSLPDQFGHRRTLDSLEGAKGLVLVFFRSADW
jgi:hypothetical protein